MLFSIEWFVGQIFDLFHCYECVHLTLMSCLCLIDRSWWRMWYYICKATVESPRRITTIFWKGQIATQYTDALIRSLSAIQTYTLMHTWPLLSAAGIILSCINKQKCHNAKFSPCLIIFQTPYYTYCPLFYFEGSSAARLHRRISQWKYEFPHLWWDYFYLVFFFQQNH